MDMAYRWKGNAFFPGNPHYEVHGARLRPLLGPLGLRPAGPARGSLSNLALQDARYVIDTITFFAVSYPENPAFFRKNRQFFENIPRKILHILNILEK